MVSIHPDFIASISAEVAEGKCDRAISIGLLGDGEDVPTASRNRIRERFLEAVRRNPEIALRIGSHPLHTIISNREDD